MKTRSAASTRKAAARPGRIHRTAIVDRKAELEPSVEVGPYSIIGPGVQIGADSWIGSHVVLQGPLRIGRGNRIYPFATIGEISQDKSATPDQPTSTVIGDGNVIREYVSIQRGTMKEFETKRGETRIGHRNWIMNYCHIAHDCVIGSDTIFANNSSLAGHVEIDLSVLPRRRACLQRLLRWHRRRRAAVRDGAGQSGRAARHQQGRPAPP
jgi:UDP-N-acetylglucosamine acyltransferase